MPQSAQKKARRKSKRKNRTQFTAKTADKFVLYQRAVQMPEADVKFLTRVFKKERGRLPLHLREDFCGTAWLCAEWVRSNRERTATGLDLDAPTLAWGQRHNIDPLGEDARRVSLLQKNVMETTRPPQDICVAFNFSYCILQERTELIRYFRSVRRSLQDDGLFALDIHGGPECYEEIEETTDHKDFEYVWDQGPVEPLSSKSHRKIHFRFPDGTEMRDAFRYDWRIWSLPELRDALVEAGFARVDVYWEGYDKKGEGNGIFRKVQRAENDDSWIAYLAAWA